MMMSGMPWAMMLGLGIVGLLVLAVLVLGILALVKYLRAGNSP